MSNELNKINEAKKELFNYVKNRGYLSEELEYDDKECGITLEVRIINNINKMQIIFIKLDTPVFTYSNRTNHYYEKGISFSDLYIEMHQQLLELYADLESFINWKYAKDILKNNMIYEDKI